VGTSPHYRYPTGFSPDSGGPPFRVAPPTQTVLMPNPPTARNRMTRPVGCVRQNRRRYSCGAYLNPRAHSPRNTETGQGRSPGPLSGPVYHTTRQVPPVPPAPPVLGPVLGPVPPVLPPHRPLGGSGSHQPQQRQG